MIKENLNPKEALERAKLLMKYDTSKTLTENVDESKLVNEAFIIPVVAAASVWGWWNYANNFNAGAQKVKVAIATCPTLLSQANAQPTPGVNHLGVVDKIYKAVEGMGTDEDAVKSALEELKTPIDFCIVSKHYSQKYEDLYSALDGEFSGSDWNTYVWGPIYNLMSSVPTPPTGGGGATPGTGGGGTTPVVGGGGATPGTGGGGGRKTRTSQYKSCPETLPVAMYCKNDLVRKVQNCLGIKADGAFGPNTKSSLEGKGVSGTEITQATIDKVCGGGSSATTTTPGKDDEVTTPESF